MWKIWNKCLPPLLHVTLLFPNPQPTSTTTFIHRLADSQEVHRLVWNCWQDETTDFYASGGYTVCTPLLGPCVSLLHQRSEIKLNTTTMRRHILKYFNRFLFHFYTCSHNSFLEQFPFQDGPDHLTIISQQPWPQHMQSSTHHQIQGPWAKAWCALAHPRPCLTTSVDASPPAKRITIS